MGIRDDIVAKLTEERSALLAEVDALGADGWSRRSGEEDWTPRQQLLHLLAVEPQYSGAATAAAGAPGSQLPGVEQRTPSYEDAESWETGRILAEMARVRTETLAAVATIGEERFEARASHGSFGEMSVLQLLRAIYRHDRMHAEQIAGREVTFQPRVMDRSSGAS